MPTQEQPAKIGKYEVLSTLGRGGMGVVYKARDPIIDRIVAVKTILVSADVSDDEGLIDRLRMEARSAGRLHHPNIVTVFDFGEQDQLSYIVMEYVEGVNLGKVIDEHLNMPLDAKVSILLQIAEGLAYAHENNVVHRDMKPSNVCITARGTAKILDFGLARFDNTRLTKTGYMAGTLAYMSPERLNGETGPKDDIFALGAIAYELLTFKRAFTGTMAPEVISKIISPEPPPKPSDVSGVPAELDAIVHKALAKDIDKRYDSAALLADDLREFMHSDALRKYMAATEGDTAKRPVSAFKPSANPYAASSGKTAAGKPPVTLQVPDKTTIENMQESTVVVPDVTATGPSTQPDAAVTQAAAQPTELVPTAKPRGMRAMAIAASIIVVLAAGYFVIGRKPAPIPPRPQPQPQPQLQPQPQPVPPPLPVPQDPLKEPAEMKMQTARALTDDVSRRALMGAEVVRFAQAKTRLAKAQQKIDANDYEAGSRLATAAITDLQAVINMNDKRSHAPQPTPQPQPQPHPQPPPQPQPQPQPAPQPPQPQPQPQPAPQPQPEPAEKQITAFMHQLAAAYQSKDVGFFREHALNYNDNFAAAIRNSPSVKVELQIEGILLHDAQHATVNVKRSDEFPDSRTNVAELAYHLERNASGWQLASISKR